MADGNALPAGAIIAEATSRLRVADSGALLAEDGIELVAMCRSGAEALAAIRAHRPDLALLDVAFCQRSPVWTSCVDSNPPSGLR